MIYFRYGALTFGDEQDVVPESVTQSKFADIQKLYAKETARVNHTCLLCHGQESNQVKEQLPTSKTKRILLVRRLRSFHVLLSV